MTMDPVVLAGRYRLVELVGRGGMAEVWRAEDMLLERQVAIKLLDRRNQDVAGSGLREAREAARLVHPNVVGIYDVASDHGRAFLVMELVAGRDLAAVLLERGPLPPVQVARIGAQAARALAAAHATGLVHRDVKPGNLLMTADGTVKLTDFGIAAPLVAAGPGPLLGTAGYISPEQAVGHPAGPASDLYALGCVLYELLTGQQPFFAEDATALLRHHVETAPTPPARLRPRIPAGLEQAVLALLAKDPAERPADAAHVAEVLETIALEGNGQGLPQTAAGPMNATQVLPSLTHAPRHSRPDDGAPAGPPRPVGPPPVWAWLGERPLLAAALGAVVVIALVTALVSVLESDDGPPRAAVPQVTEPAAEEGSSVEPTPRPKRRPSGTAQAPPARQNPSALLAALRQRLGRQAAAGQLHPKAAKDVDRRLQEVARKLAEGKTGEAAGKLAEARQKLTEAAQKGRWSPDPTVTRLMNELAAAL